MASKVATMAAALLVCSRTALGKCLDADSSAGSVCAPPVSDAEGSSTEEAATLLQVGRRAAETAKEASQLQGFQFWIHGRKHEKKQSGCHGCGAARHALEAARHALEPKVSDLSRLPPARVFNASGASGTANDTSGASGGTSGASGTGGSNGASGCHVCAGDGRWNAVNPNNLTELEQPEQLRSPVVLRVQAANLSTPFIKRGSYAITRGYNGKVPGPMIVMKPGTTTYLKVVNELGNNTDMNTGFCNDPHASPHPLQPLEGVGPTSAHLCELNTTNFHTHGLHTSPLPGHDEVKMTRILPGESFDFSFELPDYHMGGTHWYHPHVHTSTSVQAGGGMHGFIHVEDIPGHLPPWIEKMPETFMFFSGVDMHLSTKFERLGSGDKLPNSGPYGFWRWIPCGPGSEAPESDEFQDCKEVDPLTEEGSAYWEKNGYKKNPAVLVNGQWQPKLTLKSGEWQRLRMAQASMELSLDVGLANPELCRVGLLAKDGLYLEKAPRWLQGPVTLADGGRADVAIACKCPKGVESCGTWLMYQTVPHEGHEEVNGMAMYLHIKQDSHGNGPSLDLQSYQLDRPCYMANLRGLSVRPENIHQLSLPCDFEPRCGKYNVTYDGTTHTSPSTALIDTLQLGTLYEWNFFHGVQYHPLHIHVTPFQITELGPFFEPPFRDLLDDEYKKSNYFEVGDWHDVLHMPYRESCKLRILPNTFTGRYMFHCHFLDHEDSGLMGYFNVTGKEGTRNEQAQEHDKRCFWNPHEAGWTKGKSKGPCNKGSCL